MTDHSLEPDLLATSTRRDLTAGSTNLIRTRWAGGVILLLATLVCGRLCAIPLPAAPLYGLGIAVLGYNGVVDWLMRRLKSGETPVSIVRVRQLVVAQIGLDWGVLAALLHLTGGICSPLVPVVLVHMLMVAVLLGGALPYLYAALHVVTLALIALLEASGVLPYHAITAAIQPGLHNDPVFVVSRLVPVTVGALAIVGLTLNIMGRLRERERRIATLLQTARVTSATLSPSELLDRLARSAAQALGVCGASIRILEEGEDLVIAASYGLSQAYLDKGPVDLSHSDLDSEVLSGRPVFVQDTAADRRVQYPAAMAREGIGSILAVPIIGRGKPLGVLCVHATQPHHFSPPDAEFVMAIAQQGATALENALAYESLQKAEQARSQFVRMVTHELRAPVGGAQSLVRSLVHTLADELTEGQRTLLARVENRLDTLLDLINDLLVLAASKTVDLEQPPKRLPLQPVLRQVIDQLTVEAESKSIRLVADLPFEVLAVRATEQGLARMFGNLIGNAIKYTPPEGQVSVRLVERPSGAVVTITDTGIGIPQEEQSHLWQNFFRAKNARKSGIVGTGLGLSIVKQLVDHFGGLISVRSEEGQGTTFKVTLPLAGPADEAW